MSTLLRAEQQVVGTSVASAAQGGGLTCPVHVPIAALAVIWGSDMQFLYFCFIDTLGMGVRKNICMPYACLIEPTI